MSATGKLELAAFDARDTDKLAAFYVELAGWEIVRNDGGWINVRTGDGQEIGRTFADPAGHPFDLSLSETACQVPGDSL